MAAGRGAEYVVGVGEKIGWIALGAVLVGIVLGGSCLCVVGGGFAWLVAGVDEADAADAQAQAEGMRAGPTMSGEECFRSAVERRLACGGYVDPGCANSEGSFLTACLQTSRDVGADLCAGVPAEGFWDTASWGTETCTRRGYEMGGPCEDLTPFLAAYCRTR